MPGEHVQEIGRTFVNKVYRFLEGKFGFKIRDLAYWAEEAATIKINGELVRFDIFMIQEIKLEPGVDDTAIINYICECKYRSDSATLQNEFKTFLKNVIKTYEDSQRKYAENFRYLFITNRAFGIWDEEFQSVEFLQNFLDDEEYSINVLSYISQKIGLLVLSEWFLDTTYRGV